MVTSFKFLGLIIDEHLEWQKKIVQNNYAVTCSKITYFVSPGEIIIWYSACVVVLPMRLQYSSLGTDGEKAQFG